MRVWVYESETRGPFIKQDIHDRTADKVTIFLADGTKPFVQMYIETSSFEIVYEDGKEPTVRNTMQKAKVVTGITGIIMELQYLFEWLPGGVNSNHKIDGPTWYDVGEDDAASTKTTRELYYHLRFWQTHTEASTR
jgi:hypothetical protein